MSSKKLKPVHPGEILMEDFIKPMNLNQTTLAREINVPISRINKIILGKRGISPDTAIRLARFFGTSAKFWLNLQEQYDISIYGDRRYKEYFQIKRREGDGDPMVPTDRIMIDGRSFLTSTGKIHRYGDEEPVVR